LKYRIEGRISAIPREKLITHVRKAKTLHAGRKTQRKVVWTLGISLTFVGGRMVVDGEVQEAWVKIRQENRLGREE
jgi:hypothetical protein